jgi:DNA polymerase-3 subunit gamma/tau
VLTTIRSRTHHYPFRLIPPGTMRAHLEKICTAESITVEPAVLPLVVRAGGGSARDSLSILDQLLAGAGPDGVTYARAVALLGVTDAALLDDMVDALAAGDAAVVYGTVDRVVEAGHDPRRFASDLLDRFRDLILLDAVPDAGERGLIDAPQDAVAHMTDQAMRLGGATVTRYAEIVHTALIEMRGTTSPRLVLELLCARMQLPDAATDSAALLQRLERLERRYTAAGTAEATPEPAATKPTAPAKAVSPAAPPPTPTPRAATPSPTKTAPTKPAPQNATPEREPWPTPPPPVQPPAKKAAPAAKAVPAPEPPEPEPVASGAPGELDAAALRRLWPEVLDIVKLSSRRTRALLDNAQITTTVGDLITLAAPAALAKMLADESNTSVLRAALTKVVGGTWRVEVDGSGNTGPQPSESTTPDAQPRGPEPDPRDDTEAEEPGAPAAVVDPEVQALRLLQDQLGARPVDEK